MTTRHRVGEGIRLGFGNPRRPPFAQFSEGVWRIWLDYNQVADSGTVIELRNDGSAQLFEVVTDGKVVSEREIVPVRVGKRERKMSCQVLKK